MALRQVDIFKGETRTPEFLAKNSLGETPVLELDDGRMLAESVAICRYFESLYPDPPLMGRDATDVAFVEMWTRRIEMHLMMTIGAAARHSFEIFANSVNQNAAFANDMRAEMKKKWAWFDQEMADGRPFAAGQDFTVADIAGMAALRICDYAEETIPDGLDHAKAWEDRLRNRESWNA